MLKVVVNLLDDVLRIICRFFLDAVVKKSIYHSLHIVSP